MKNSPNACLVLQPLDMKLWVIFVVLHLHLHCCLPLHIKLMEVEQQQWRCKCNEGIHSTSCFTWWVLSNVSCLSQAHSSCRIIVLVLLTQLHGQLGQQPQTHTPGCLMLVTRPLLSSEGLPLLIKTSIRSFTWCWNQCWGALISAPCQSALCTEGRDGALVELITFNRRVMGSTPALAVT